MTELGEAAHDIAVLNGLIETTLDSVDGYHRASLEAPSRNLRSAFAQRCRERELVVRRLRERVWQLGSEPEDEGTMLARAHRAFLFMRDRVDEDAVIAEVDHGESYLAGKWQSALADDRLTDDTRQLINGCYESVRQGHEQWRAANEQSTGNAAKAFATAGLVAGSMSTYP